MRPGTTIRILPKHNTALGEPTLRNSLPWHVREPVDCEWNGRVWLGCDNLCGGRDEWTPEALRERAFAVGPRNDIDCIVEQLIAQGDLS